jgi:hypothetical protein
MLKDIGIGRDDAVTVRGGKRNQNRTAAYLLHDEYGRQFNG